MHARSIVDLRSVGRPTTTPARFFPYLVHLSPPPWFGLTVVRNVDRRGIEEGRKIWRKMNLKDVTYVVWNESVSIRRYCNNRFASDGRKRHESLIGLDGCSPIEYLVFKICPRVNNVWRNVAFIGGATMRMWNEDNFRVETILLARVIQHVGE